MNSMNPNQSRLLALAILVLVIVAAVVLVFDPLYNRYVNASEEVERLEHQIAVYKRVASGLIESEEELNALQQNNPTADLYLSETKPTLAAAELQQQLNRMVSDSGGQVVSTQILQRSTETVLPTVSLQVHVRSEIDELVKLMHQIESGKPLLFIENLVISAAVRRAPQRVNRARRNQPVRRQLPSLDVRFDLIGHSGKEG
ncbi:type II secretion system protein GspM [Pontibacterium granulatum]|uniref:type II secretion system protein GspM n=1 Tax=Pontibacterium granulatum TaxID=2036029 RepID=UPI00249CB5C7|nr:type II secretion system protein GspM [Pontibacterium granulatum]MDI3324157.1 type II secretion system protein GspM [Pontibacterium granulatum]